MNVFDWKSVLLAKHAQHVVLIHFPIALFIAAVAFDVLALRLQRRELAEVAYYNLLGAALFSVPTVLSGLIAWQWALEGHRLKGILLYHLVFALASTTVILLSWWIHFRMRRVDRLLAASWRIPVELVGVLLVIVTGHLGGFLSGVNGGG
jgi:uncharacterized membrane protein